MMNPRHLPRLLALLATSLLAVSACAGGNGLSLNAYTAPAISPLLAGLADSVLPSYYSWFNTPNNPDTPNPLQMSYNAGTITGIADNASKIVMLDPACGLDYAWDKMQNNQSQQGQYNDQQPIGLASASRPGYNPATQQVLILVRGYSIGNPASSADYTGGVLNSCSKRQAGYIPLILDLVSGRWNVDGLASPGATITIRMSTFNDMSPVNSSGQLISQETIVSPLRLTRFEVTASNFARVMKFATVGSNLGLARQVSWFRTSDINPDYTYSNLNTDHCIPFLAFWGAGGAYQELNYDTATYGTAFCPQLSTLANPSSNYYSDSNQRDATNSFDYIDTSWRQSDNKGNLQSSYSPSLTNSDTSQTAAKMDEDDIGKVGACPPGSNLAPELCNIVSAGNANPQFQHISGDLEILALTATKTDDGHPLAVQCDPTGNVNKGTAGNSSGMSELDKNRADAFCDIQQQLYGTYGGSAYFSSVPAGDIGSWQSLPSDVFGLVSDNGAHARDITVDTIHDQAYARGLNGFVGQPNISGNPLNTVTTTITPTMSVVALQTDAAQAAFYQKYSFFNSDTSAVQLMSFSTADPNKIVADPTHPDAASNTAGIPYVQAPLVQLEIDVSNTLDITNTASYLSSYLPLYALNHNGPEVGVSVHYDPLTQFPEAVTQAINGLIYNIYSATVGSWTGSLTSGATQNLFALPMLTQYQVLYYSNGNPVYAHSNLVLSTADYNVLLTKAGGTDLPKYSTLSKQEKDEYTCTEAAHRQYFIGLLADPNKVSAYGMCLAQDPFYSLWDFFRSLSILLMVLLIARYFFGLIAFETGQIRPIGFLARVFIAMGLTLGMNIILGILARGVADTILITNMVGTNLSGGQSYNFLWLFADYLRAPAHDLSVINLFFLFPFTAIGLLFIIVSSWLRVGVALLVVCLSPIWVFSLLTDRQMKVFTSGLSMLFRLYLVPMAALFILLALFLVSRVVGLDPTQKTGLYQFDLIGAIVRMMFMIAVAVLPWFLAKYLAIAPVAALKTAIAKTTEMADHAGANAWLEAGASGVAALNASNAARRKEEREKIEAGEKSGDEVKALGPGEGDEDLAYGENDDSEMAAGEAASGQSRMESVTNVVEELAAGAAEGKKPDSAEGGESGAENLALADPLADEAEDGSQDALAEGDEDGEGEALAAEDDDSAAADALAAGDEGDLEEAAEDSDPALDAGTEEDWTGLGEGGDEEAEEIEQGDIGPLTPQEQAQLDFFDNARRLANGPLPPVEGTGGMVLDPLAQELNDYSADIGLLSGGYSPTHEPAPLSPEAEKAQRAAFFEDRRRMAAGQLPLMAPDEFRDAHVRVLNQNRLAAAALSDTDAMPVDAAGGKVVKRTTTKVSHEEHWSGGRPGAKAASMLALIPGHDAGGHLAVSAANRGNRPRFMDRFGTKTRKALHAAAVVTDLDAIKADWVGSAERPGSLRHQGRIIRNAGLLSTITGTAFIERVSSAELKGARETVKAYNDPARRQQWLARDPDALRQFQEAEVQIKNLQTAVAKNPEDLETQMRLMEAESTRGAILAAAKPDAAFARQYTQAQQVVADAKELGGAGTNFGRAMATKTKAFQDSVTAYQAGGRTSFSDEDLDPRRWAVRLAANSQTRARMARTKFVATDARWSDRQQDAVSAQAQLRADLDSLAMARADAASAATSRGALVNDITRHLDAGRTDSLSSLVPLVDDPAKFAEQLEKERALAAARVQSAQKPYQNLDAQITKLLVGGRPPEQALAAQRAQAENIRAEVQAADNEVTALMAALHSGNALPPSTQENYQARLALAQERHEAAVEQARQHEELAGRIAARVEGYKRLERQRAATMGDRQSAGAADKAFLATLEDLAAKAADPAARPALAEALRSGQHAHLSAAGSGAQGYGQRLDTLVKSLATAQHAGDAAARAEGEKARAALLASAKSELGAEGAARLTEALREGVARETELLARQEATSSSFSKTVGLRSVPPIFSVLHPRRALSAIGSRHVGTPNESAVYARQRAAAAAALESLRTEEAILEETATRNARDRRDDPHLTEALAAHRAAMAQQQAIIDGINVHDQIVALTADQRRAERLGYREKLHQSSLEQHGVLKRQLERRHSAEILWNQAQEAAIHGKVDAEAVERLRAGYEQESRLAAAESEKLRRLEADQQDFLSQND